MKNLKIIFLFFLPIAVFVMQCSAAELRIKPEKIKSKKLAQKKESEFAIALGYPYLGVKYGNKEIAGEVRASFGSGIKLFAGRFYWHFFDRDSVRLFTGADIGYIDFDNTYDISGEGWEISIFGGVETFITDWFSTALSFAPVYINLKSGSKGVDGIEYVVDFTIYIFPFKTGRGTIINSGAQ